MAEKCTTLHLIWPWSVKVWLSGDKKLNYYDKHHFSRFMIRYSFKIRMIELNHLIILVNDTFLQLAEFTRLFDRKQVFLLTKWVTSIVLLVLTRSSVPGPKLKKDPCRTRVWKMQLMHPGIKDIK